MPPRLRPTSRLLTPVGWAGLLALVALVALGAAAALTFGLPRH